MALASSCGNGMRDAQGLISLTWRRGLESTFRTSTACIHVSTQSHFTIRLSILPLSTWSVISLGMCSSEVRGRDCQGTHYSILFSPYRINKKGKHKRSVDSRAICCRTRDLRSRDGAWWRGLAWPRRAPPFATHTWGPAKSSPTLLSASRIPCRLRQSASNRLTEWRTVRARANPLSLAVWHFTLRFCSSD